MKPDKEPAAEKSRSRFLELPPELRNRIYEFAIEDPDRGKYKFCPGIFHPSVIHPRRLSQQDLSHRHNFQFYGLTQVCREIRQEYRSIWLRRLRVGLDNGYVDWFANLFKLEDENYKYAPEIIHIFWPFEDIEYRMNLTTLLKMKAARPDIVFEIIPTLYKIYNMCKFCLQSATGEDDEFLLPTHANCLGGVTQCEIDEWKSQRSDLNFIVEVLSNDKKSWKDMVRNDPSFLVLANVIEDEPLVIELMSEGQIWDCFKNFRSALKQLEEWEMQDLFLYGVVFVFTQRNEVHDTVRGQQVMIGGAKQIKIERYHLM